MKPLPSVNLSGTSRMDPGPMKAWEESLRRKLLQGDAVPRNGSQSAAVALIVRDGKGLEVLLIERVEREGDPWSGQISLPGGMWGRGDEALSETSRRETIEEVSMDVRECCSLVGRLPPIRPRNVPELVVFPFVYSLQGEVSIHGGEEVKEAFWYPVAEMMASASERRVRVRGHELLVPSFLHGERVIWGLTHRILTSFLELGVVERWATGRGHSPTGSTM